MASEPTAQTCSGCGTTIDTTAAEPLARIACPTCGKKIRVERTFDHFAVVETLGVGGMGTVYKARDMQLDRFVALKLLRRDLGAEEDHKDRLQQEARIAAAVNHGLASTGTQRWGIGGVVWGTPEYVSPERLNNDPEDFRSDIYSLGATLFHAIAGKPPIEASTNSATALLESKQRPLDLQVTAPNVSAATAEVLQRMIAADPAQRFSSYDDLVAELERAWRALALEDAIRGDETRRRRRWLSALSGFTRRSLEGLRGVLRWVSGLPLLIRLALPAIVAAGILFVIARSFLPSWTELTAFATSWFDRGPWNKALASYKEQVALYQFAQAAEEIRNVKLIGGYYKPAEDVAEKRARLMFDWKNTLMDDLNRAHFSGTLTDSSGAQYIGIVSATDEGLTMKLPYGIAWITWDKLSPKEILAVSKSFIDPGALGAADRQWRCAVFASETGQTEAARELAEAAARANPEYKEQTSLLSPDISRAAQATR